VAEEVPPVARHLVEAVEVRRLADCRLVLLRRAAAAVPLDPLAVVPPAADLPAQMEKPG